MKLNGKKRSNEPIFGKYSGKRDEVRRMEGVGASGKGKPTDDQKCLAC